MLGIVCGLSTWQMFVPSSAETRCGALTFACATQTQPNNTTITADTTNITNNTTTTNNNNSNTNNNTTQHNTT